MDYTKLSPEALMALAPFFAKLARIRTAHGVMMPLAVIFWFPLGVFLLRLLKIKNPVRWHAIWQTIGLALLLSGFGLGRYLSNNSGRNKEGHVVFGTVLVVVFILMPIIGWLHHRHFVTKGAKDFKSPMHIWGGRILLLLAFINGITGLRLSKNKSSAYIAYGVVSGFLAVTYAGILYIQNRKLKATTEETELQVTVEHK
ncbi:hypothetical protein BKA66DRAFT_607976 [Pyrenochaeta sp. MPI-SDFR-AT-0127]|nr:hypothetical protein BKA66DRAFT_607976 [Pyrenochaeta sp. MPI-SDFR-AT-0127]